MRTEDLQIRDWVQNPLGLIGRVQSIKYMPKDHGDVYGGYYLVIIAFGESYQTLDIKDVQPIPLTPEILEKNFQEFLPGINLMYQLKGPYCAMNEDGQWVFGLVQVDGDNSARYPLVKISFVHELQHVLKLCGIDKDIQI